MNQKKISIIIPCFNSKKYIEDCFESVRNQTIGMENIQVVFVDDASTDNTIEYLDKYRREYPESVELIELEENHRQGGARNKGLVRAEGEYVMFLDSDDWLDPCMCEKAYKKAVEFNIDILQFPFVHVYGENEFYTDESSQYGFLDGTVSGVKRGMLIGMLFTFGSQNKLYRRELLESQKAAFPEKVVYEEPYFVYPLLFEAERFFCMEEGLYYYRQTGQSVTVQHMKGKNTLYDHPFVQLELLKKLISKGYIKEYYSEIEYHFLHSYYLETLYFAGKGNRFLGADYFRNMQRTILELFPEYEENPYLQMADFGKLRKELLLLRQEFSQEELDRFCREVVQLVDAGQR